MKKYLFIDRDGTLIEEPDDFQVDSLQKFKLVPGCISCLTSLKNAGFKFVMITNQDGLGGPLNPQASFDLIQDLLLSILGSQGIFFEEILICPHLPEDNCKCRKPGLGLVKNFISSNEMDRENSFVIGDRITDLELASNMGLQGFLLSTTFNWSDLTHEILLKPRTAILQRKTKETDIQIKVDLNGRGLNKISTGINFFDHMLEQLALHGGFDLYLSAKGDLHIDDHHIVEDVALCIDEALKNALGDKRGISRYGFFLPMDESSTKVALDLSGRASSIIQVNFDREKVNDLSTEMIIHFFQSFSQSLQMSLHMETEGKNAHHMAESMFKAVGRSLKQAFLKSNNDINVPSTKGIL